MTEPVKLSLELARKCSCCPPQDALPVVEVLCPHGYGYPVKADSAQDEGTPP
jgi:hypothetical protein